MKCHLAWMPAVRALCQLILHARVKDPVLQDMGVAASGNMVPVPLEIRGRVSHLDENPFSQWCATDTTISFKKKKRQKTIPETTVCLSPLGGPTLSSWDILYLVITPLTDPYQGMLSSIIS